MAETPQTERGAELERLIESMLADHEAAMANIGRNRPSIEEALGRLDNWLLATLVAVNGAAAVALLSAIHELQGSVRGPVTLFVVGVVAALGAGLFNYEYHSRAFLATEELLDHEKPFREAARSRDATGLQEHRPTKAIRLLTWARWLNGISRSLFLISFGCFVAGCFRAGNLLP
ncbi:MAG TPA: hypothetical protein VEA61_04180 [Allosphingosinicella sp.]|nr:hypothetical protein [Allosphingosinicella sp.]